MVKRMPQSQVSIGTATRGRAEASGAVDENGMNDAVSHRSGFGA